MEEDSDIKGMGITELECFRNRTVQTELSHGLHCADNYRGIVQIAVLVSGCSQHCIHCLVKSEVLQISGYVSSDGLINKDIQATAACQLGNHLSDRCVTEAEISYQFLFGK